MAKNNKDNSVIEQKNNEIKEAQQEEQPKFIALIKDKDGSIKFNIEGLTMDEALIVIKKGKVQFEKLYEQWLGAQ